MGRTAIEEKIGSVLSAGVKNEQDVFYIIAQMRKYFESRYPIRADRDAKYPTFFLIADWIVHPSLDRNPAKQQIQKFATFFQQQQKDEMFNFMESGFTLFKDLRNELKDILHIMSLNQSIVTERKKWLTIVGLLIGILKDLPLLSDGLIKSFKFHDGFWVDDKQAISFTISFADGHSKNFTMDLEHIDLD